MGSSNSGRAAADLQRLCQRFTAWRSRRAIGTRIPAPLWRAAVALACQQGVGRTALALGLSYHALRRRVESRTANESVTSQARPARRRLKRGVEPQRWPTGAESPRPTFVELSAAHDGAWAALPHAALRNSSRASSSRADTLRDIASPAGTALDAPRGCLIEWTRVTGGTLRIHLTNHSVSEIAALCRQLGGCG